MTKRLNHKLDRPPMTDGNRMWLAQLGALMYRRNIIRFPDDVDSVYERLNKMEGALTILSKCEGNAQVKYMSGVAKLALEND